MDVLSQGYEPRPELSGAAAESDLSSPPGHDLDEPVEVDVDVDRKLEHEEHVLHLLPTFDVDGGVVDVGSDVFVVGICRRIELTKLL